MGLSDRFHGGLRVAGVPRKSECTRSQTKAKVYEIAQGLAGDDEATHAWEILLFLLQEEHIIRRCSTPSTRAPTAISS